MDSKWLELLKLGGLPTFAITCASGLFLWFANIHFLPPLEPWMTILAWAVFLVSGCLALAAILKAAWDNLPLRPWWRRYSRTKKEREMVRKYIPFMTDHERNILGFLLFKNQKSFTCAADGGHAATLISRGIIRRALQPNQIYTEQDMPVLVPDHIWEVIAQNKEHFPVQDSRMHPWRERMF